MRKAINKVKERREEKAKVDKLLEFWELSDIYKYKPRTDTYIKRMLRHRYREHGWTHMIMLQGSEEVILGCGCYFYIIKHPNNKFMYHYAELEGRLFESDIIGDLGDSVSPLYMITNDGRTKVDNSLENNSVEQMKRERECLEKELGDILTTKLGAFESKYKVSCGDVKLSDAEFIDFQHGVGGKKMLVTIGVKV